MSLLPYGWIHPMLTLLKLLLWISLADARYDEDMNRQWELDQQLMEMDEDERKELLQKF